MWQAGVRGGERYAKVWSERIERAARVEQEVAQAAYAQRDARQGLLDIGVQWP